ncbi:hypothetical protein SPURM210S_07523 [Streptomyces purpurascens]
MPGRLDRERRDGQLPRHPLVPPRPVHRRSPIRRHPQQPLQRIHARHMLPLPRQQQPHRRPRLGPLPQVLDPEQIPRPRDRHLQQPPGSAVPAHAAGADHDLVGQHEVAQDADAETGVGVEAELGLREFAPGDLFLDVLGQVDEAGAALGEDAAEFGEAHADAVVAALEVGAAVGADALDELDPALPGRGGAAGALEVLRAAVPVPQRVQRVLVQLADRQFTVAVELFAHEEFLDAVLGELEADAVGELVGGVAVEADPAAVGVGRQGAERGQGGVVVPVDLAEEGVDAGGVFPQGDLDGRVGAHRVQGAADTGVAPVGAAHGDHEFAEVDAVVDAEVLHDDLGQVDGVDGHRVGRLEQGGHQGRAHLVLVAGGGGDDVVVVEGAGRAAGGPADGEGGRAVFLQQPHQPVRAQRVGHPRRLVGAARHLAEEGLELLRRVQLRLLDQPAVEKPPADALHGAAGRGLVVQGAQPALEAGEALAELAEAGVVGAGGAEVRTEYADALCGLLGPEGLLDQGHQDRQRGLGRGQSDVVGQPAGEEVQSDVGAPGQFGVVPGVVAQGVGRALVRRGQPGRQGGAGLLEVSAGGTVGRALPDRVLFGGTDPRVRLGAPVRAGQQREILAAWSGRGLRDDGDLLHGPCLAVGAVEFPDPFLHPRRELVQAQGMRVRRDRVREGAGEEAEGLARLGAGGEARPDRLLLADEQGQLRGLAGMHVRHLAAQRVGDLAPGPGLDAGQCRHRVAVDALAAGVDEEDDMTRRGVLKLPLPADLDATLGEHPHVEGGVLRDQEVLALEVLAVPAEQDQQRVAPAGVAQETADAAVDRVGCDAALALDDLRCLEAAFDEHVPDPLEVVADERQVLDTRVVVLARSDEERLVLGHARRVRRRGGMRLPRSSPPLCSGSPRCRSCRPPDPRPFVRQL